MPGKSKKKTLELAVDGVRSHQYVSPTLRQAVGPLAVARQVQGEFDLDAAA